MSTSIMELQLQVVETEEHVRLLFELMSQLRPHLASADAFVEQWRRQVGEGYRLVAMFDDAKAMALAGYRVQENMVHGRFLYVDDLVTDAQARGHGCGRRLMTWLRHQAGTMNCGKLVLDTPLNNSLGHRFYFRCGLLATSLRFNTAIEGGASS